MIRLFLIALLLLSNSARTEPLVITVSIQPQKYFVERIGGSHVEVMVLVGPGQNPSTYMPTVGQMTGVANSHLLVTIGVPFERTWLDSVLSNYQNLHVLDLSRVDGNHDHDHDPHIWTNPVVVRSMATQIGETLAQLDPANANQYVNNTNMFVRELDTLDRDISDLLKPLAGRKFMTYHASWDFFAEQYKLEQIAIEKNGKTPSAKHLVSILNLGRKSGIKNVLVQPQFSERFAQIIALDLDAKLVTADPLAEDYPNNMRRVAQAIAEASVQ